MKHAWLFAVLPLGCAAAPPAPVATATHTTSAALVAPQRAPVAAEPESMDPPRHAERVVGKLRPRFRHCYQRGLLDENPGMAGVVVLHLRVAADGTVRTADVAKREGLSANVAACLSRQAEAATFDPPGAGGATLDVPVHFVRGMPGR